MFWVEVVMYLHVIVEFVVLVNLMIKILLSTYKPCTWRSSYRSLWCSNSSCPAWKLVSAAGTRTCTSCCKSTDNTRISPPDDPSTLCGSSTAPPNSPSTRPSAISRCPQTVNCISGPSPSTLRPGQCTHRGLGRDPPRPPFLRLHLCFLFFLRSSCRWGRLPTSWFWL